MPTRDIVIRRTDEWRPWHLPKLSADPWRGPEHPHPHPVFRPNEPALRPLRVGISFGLFRALKQTTKLRFLDRLLAQDVVRTFVIPVGDVMPPPGFDRSFYIGQRFEAVENWAQYLTIETDGKTRLVVRSAAAGEAVEAGLSVDDRWFRSVAGVQIDGPFTIPTNEATRAGTAFQTLVAKALRCDLFITETSDLVDLEGEHGYRYPTETVSHHAAIPILGLYLRALGRYHVDTNGRLGRHRRVALPIQGGFQATAFFQTAVLCMLWATSEWRSLATRLATPTEQEAFRLSADSVLHRLEQLLRERDRLLQRLAVAPDGVDAAYTAGDALDAILLLALAASDAAADAVNLLFAIGAKRPSWSGGALATALPGHCQRLADLFQAQTGGDHYRVWQVVSVLRNAIHAEAVTRSPTVFVVHDFAGRVLLPIPPTRFAKINPHLQAMGGLDHWGVYERVHGADRAHLHPGEFAEELIPRVFAFIHRIMLETLACVGVPASTWSGNRYGRPLSGDEERTLALLGLERVPY